MPEIIKNWAGNVCYRPESVFEPHNEDELLELLNTHRNHTVRVVGAGHSWSEVTACCDVLLNLRHFDQIEITQRDDGSVWAEIGAGCRIANVLQRLRKQGYTLPAYGILGALTMAGAISTATHGSGRSSMAHYVGGIRAAAYDPDTGEAKVYQWDGGRELEAARCALGCMGIVIAIRVPLEPSFLVEERTTKGFSGIGELVEQQSKFPLQQFYLIPWSWKWFAQQRRRADDSQTVSKNAGLYHLYRYIMIEFLFHALIRFFSSKFRFFKRSLIPFIYRHFPVHTWKVTDHAERILMMRHDRFRHLEMELFVPAALVTSAAEFVEGILRYCCGDSEHLPKPVADVVASTGAMADLKRLQNSHIPDYLITFRHVLPDDTLISMTSGDETARYAISFITFDDDSGSFLAVCRFMAKVMGRQFDARPHWGKVFPLEAGELMDLYPKLPEFGRQCAKVDPGGVFQNEFSRRKLGLTRGCAIGDA